MRSVIFLVLLMAITANARIRSDQFGDCLANFIEDTHKLEITFVCYKSAYNKFNESENVQCRDSQPFHKNVVTFINFLNCEMSKLPADLLTPYERIEILNVSGMKLESVNLTKSDSLVELYASNNYLKDVPSVDPSEHLKKLDLSHNPIENLDENSFRNMPALTNLILANTSLSTIAPDTFLNQERLQVVDLSANHLTEIDMTLFLPSFFSLKEIRLDENEMSELKEMPSTLFINLHIFSITHNNFKCDRLRQFLFGNNGWENRLRFSKYTDETSISRINEVTKKHICTEERKPSTDSYEYFG